MEEFSYVIARKWDEDEPLDGDNVCIYAMQNEIQFGDLSDAQHALNYVTRTSGEKDYKILKVSYTVLE